MAIGKKTGGGSRLGSPNKNRTALARIIETAISTRRRMQLLAELAEGVTVSEGERVYTKPPDTLAIKQLNEYQYGRPAQRIEGIGENGEHVVRVIFEDAR